MLTTAAIFSVLTEFKFGIGEALLNSERLQTAVDGISTSADTALLALGKLGASSALGSIAGLGLAGSIAKAVEVADKFAMSQNALANIISANMDHLQGNIGTFNERLLVTETIMGKISRAARDFALDEGTMLDMTKLMSAQLIPKGLAGDNFGNAIDLSRNLLKSAPSLGLDVNDIQGQLLRTIEGSASMGDTLFRRLVTDTKAMGAFRGKKDPTREFNTLPAVQRVKLLQTALNQFASDTQVLKANVESLSGQFRLMQTLVFGPISSVLRPLGEALRKPIIKALQSLNAFIDGPLRGIIKSMATMITNVLEDPRKFLIQLMQLSRLKKDTNIAATILGAVEVLSSFSAILLFLQKVLPVPRFMLLSNILKVVGDGVRWVAFHLRSMLGSVAGFVFSMRGLNFLFQLGKFAIGSILLPLTLLTGILQGISRGMALAKVEDMEAMMRLAPQLTQMAARVSAVIQNIMLPFNFMIEGIGQLTKEFFKFSTGLEFLLSPMDSLIQVFEFLGKAVVTVMAAISATFAGVFRMVENFQRIQREPIQDKGTKGTVLTALLGEPLAKLATTNRSMGEGVAGTWQDEFDAFIKDNLRTVQDGKGVQNNVTNNNFSGNITIKNDFKEQQEPDRVAFKMSEQLQKLGANRTQAKGRSLKAGFVGAGGN